MRYKLSVFGASWAIVLGLEYLFDMPFAEVLSNTFWERFCIGALLAAGATFFWLQLRPLRQLPSVAGYDSEIMDVQSLLVPQLYLKYGKMRTELLERLGENILLESEEKLYADSVVWRRRYQANTSSSNKANCEFHFDNLHDLHAAWEQNAPELKELNERIGNCREALFILQYGTAEEIRVLLADPKASRLATKQKEPRRATNTSSSIRTERPALAHHSDKAEYSEP